MIRNIIIIRSITCSETAKRYFELVEKLSPNEMLQKFAETAPRNVQEATKSTIVNILGSLPNYALDAALITTSSKLANLLFQMQLTGYMFKNAEYRMSLTRSLKGFPRLPPAAAVSDGNTTLYLQDGARAVGTVEVVTQTGETVSVPADSLMQALSKEVRNKYKKKYKYKYKYKYHLSIDKLMMN